MNKALIQLFSCRVEMRKDGQGQIHNLEKEGAPPKNLRVALKNFVY